MLINKLTVNYKNMEKLLNKRAIDYYIDFTINESQNTIYDNIVLLQHAYLILPHVYDKLYYHFVVNYRMKYKHPNIHYIKYRMYMNDCIRELSQKKKTEVKKIKLSKKTLDRKHVINKKYNFSLNGLGTIIDGEYTSLNNLKKKSNTKL